MKAAARRRDDTRRFLCAGGLGLEVETEAGEDEARASVKLWPASDITARECARYPAMTSATTTDRVAGRPVEDPAGSVVVMMAVVVRHGSSLV